MIFCQSLALYKKQPFLRCYCLKIVTLINIFRKRGLLCLPHSVQEMILLSVWSLGLNACRQEGSISSDKFLMESGQDANISVCISGGKGSRQTHLLKCTHFPEEIGKVGWGILDFHAILFSFVLFLL